MKTFNDSTGRPWGISINVASIRRARELTGVNLVEAFSKESLERLVGDPCTLADVLYALVKPEADERGVSDEDFGRSLGGDAIDQATDALLESLVDFAPAHKRGVMRRMLEKMKALQQTCVDHAGAMLESGEIERELEARLRAIRDESAEGAEQ